MNETYESRQKSALENGAAAAHAVRGAVKAGKAVSAMAKGAAAGPYGAAAGLLWAGRRQIGKFAAAAITLLLLPVLFLLLLPGLIFGGFASDFSAADTENPILNSGTAITDTANEISMSISRILQEGLTDVSARIETDFSISGADEMEIINPYAGNLVFNANLFISQYCAFRSTDFASLSLSDLERLLRQGKQNLYSFTRAEEERTRTETEPETGEETETTETWMIYTVHYNGEAYFADHIFGLSEEQKELAADYSQNLSLFLSDGTLQGLTEWTGSSIPALGDVSFTDGGMEVVYFNQMDERYANQPYGTDNIGGYGCGPTSMAIVVSSLTGTTVDPAAMSRWAYENGYWCKGSGSYHSLIPGAAAHWNLPVSGCSASEPQRILDALADGKLVVAIMSKGHFTKSGHFIVLRGVKDGKILVADPGSYTRSGKLWDLSIITSEASRRAGAGGPFWIIG